MKEWHFEKNTTLQLFPNNLSPGSPKKVWWICYQTNCKENCGHTWQAAIVDRTREQKPSGCPFCSGNKICQHNSLQSLNPKLMQQWHHKKNNALQIHPEQISSSSHKKVWWICST